MVGVVRNVGAPGTWLLLVGLAAAAGVLGHAVGCGADSPVTPTTVSTVGADPEALLREAVATTLKLESAAFTLEHQQGTTTLLPGLEMTKATGVADIPSKVKLRIDAQLAFPRTFVGIDVVTIGDQAYMTDLLTGAWLQVEPGSLPMTFGNLAETLANIIEAVDGPDVVGSERLKGAYTTRIRGTVQSDRLSGLVPGASLGEQVGLELWLQQPDNLLLQVRIMGKVVPTDIDTAVRTLTLDDINVPVDIVAPE